MSVRNWSFWAPSNRVLSFHYQQFCPIEKSLNYWIAIHQDISSILIHQFLKVGPWFELMITYGWWWFDRGTQPLMAGYCGFHNWWDKALILWWEWLIDYEECKHFNLLSSDLWAFLWSWNSHQLDTKWRVKTARTVQSELFLIILDQQDPQKEIPTMVILGLVPTLQYRCRKT